MHTITENALELFASLAESDPGKVAQRFLVGIIEQRGVMRGDADHGRFYVGDWAERLASNLKYAFDGRHGLHADCECSIGFASGLGEDAVGDLALHHEDDCGGPGVVRQEVEDDGGSDVVRDIPDHLERAHIGSHLVEGEIEDIPMDHRCGRIVGELICEGTSELVVEFDENETPNLSHEMVRECAATRPDLEHFIVGTRIDRADDLTLQVRIDQEVLTERAFGSVRPVCVGSVHGSIQTRTRTAVRSSGGMSAS